MNNDHDYISVICTTVVAMLALVSVLIGVIVRSNSSEPKETAEEAAIIQQFEQLQYRVKCEKAENNTCLEYSVYRVFKE